MCTTCGCGHGETRIDGVAPGDEGHAHEHRHADGTVHAHPHDHATDHEHVHEHGGGHRHQHADGTWHSHDHGAPTVLGALNAAHAHGTGQARIVQVEQDILAKNNAYAAQNRGWFADRGIFALNLVSSPGSGKTTLLVRTIEALAGRVPVAVIEGDQQTSRDADRIRATGAPAVQINTGKGCHLDAHMVGHALATLRPAEGALLLIENVGNLVCPAAFDLGEAHKVVILSVTEGEDKPLKYPDMFRAADLMLLNKVDLLPHLAFDAAAAVDFAQRVRPGLRAIRVSATRGDGFDEWLAWLEQGIAAARAQRGASVDALRRRVADLEARLAAAGGQG